MNNLSISKLFKSTENTLMTKQMSPNEVPKIIEICLEIHIKSKRTSQIYSARLDIALHLNSSQGVAKFG